jgi:hypothetical protein
MAAASSLANLVPAERATRIDAVVARMRGIARRLPEHDGVAAFNELYLAVTETVSRSVSREFEDPVFVRRLDVAFANLYFDALRARRVPRAWAPLFEARSRRGILPIQFALAGMNAHINRDLPIALATTCAARRIDLRRAAAQHRDFRRIDKLLAQTEARVKRSFATGLLADADAALGQVDDVLAMWNVERAREAAWVNAETLAALDPLPRLRAEFLRTLDRTVGFASRGLLRPVTPA